MEDVPPPPTPAQGVLRRIRKKCLHGKLKGYCREPGCHGERFCPHGKQKGQCKELGCYGNGFCQHGKRKGTCRESGCYGQRFCVHGKVKGFCREPDCYGYHYCTHGKQKQACRESDCLLASSCSTMPQMTLHSSQASLNIGQRKSRQSAGAWCESTMNLCRGPGNVSAELSRDAVQLVQAVIPAATQTDSLGLLGMLSSGCAEVAGIPSCTHRPWHKAWQHAKESGSLPVAPLVVL
jgi:hypothetical protein